MRCSLREIEYPHVSQVNEIIDRQAIIIDVFDGVDLALREEKKAQKQARKAARQEKKMKIAEEARVAEEARLAEEARVAKKAKNSKRDREAKEAKKTTELIVNISNKKFEEFAFLLFAANADHALTPNNRKYYYDSILNEFKPDVVMVQGDTTTVLAAALASYYKQIPIAHVEAGLRTGEIYSPWPEEGNRQMRTVITKYHFAPTSSAKDNLIKENVNLKK